MDIQFTGNSIWFQPPQPHHDDDDDQNRQEEFIKINAWRKKNFNYNDAEDYDEDKTNWVCVWL